MNTGLLSQLDAYYSQVDEAQEPIHPDEVGALSVRVSELPTPLPSRSRPGWLVAVAAAVAVLVLGLLTLLTGETASEAPVLSQPSPSPTVTTPGPVPSTPNPVADEELDSSRGCFAPSIWSRVCDDAAGFDGAAMWSVTAGGPGLVAVGGEDFVYYTRGDSSRPENGGDADAVVWISPDGVSWSRVPHNEAIFGGDGEQQMFSVTVGGPGFVAVGSDATLNNEEGDAAVWTSPDGVSWSRVPHNEAIFGGEGHQRMVSVTVGGPGLVAVGFDAPAGNEEGNAAVWISPDGFTWSRVPHDEGIFGGRSEQKMLSVTVGGPGLVAVGSDGHSDDASDHRIDPLAADAAVWTSTDGFTWSRVPHDEAVFGGDGEQRMVSVTAGGPGLVAVGTVSGEIDGANPGRENTDAAVWTSPDGFTWSRVPHDKAVFGVSFDHVEGATGQEQMLSVIAGGPGLVAVGFNGHDDNGWDAAVWTSPDGFIWTLVPQASDNDPMANGYDRMQSVTIGDSGLVAVGADHLGEDSVAAVWND